MPRRPNILLILTDDHAAHAISAYGSVVNQTPRILGPDGLRVEPGYATDVLTDLSLRWLDGLAGDEPWCLLLCHKAPHRPWEPDAAHAGIYAGADIPLPATFDDDLATRSESVRRVEMSIVDHLTAEDLKQPVPDGLTRAEEARWKYRRYMEDYLAVVASVDDNVGRVVDHLAERGELDDTIWSMPPTRGSSSATTAGSTSA